MTILYDTIFAKDDELCGCESIGTPSDIHKGDVLEVVFICCNNVANINIALLCGVNGVVLKHIASHLDVAYSDLHGSSQNLLQFGFGGISGQSDGEIDDTLSIVECGVKCPNLLDRLCFDFCSSMLHIVVSTE